MTKRTSEERSVRRLQKNGSAVAERLKPSEATSLAERIIKAVSNHGHLTTRNVRSTGNTHGTSVLSTHVARITSPINVVDAVEDDLVVVRTAVTKMEAVDMAVEDSVVVVEAVAVTEEDPGDSVVTALAEVTTAIMLIRPTIIIIIAVANNTMENVRNKLVNRMTGRSWNTIMPSMDPRIGKLGTPEAAVVLTGLPHALMDGEVHLRVPRRNCPAHLRLQHKKNR